MHQYPDRCKYEITIPATNFTTSFNTKKTNSIFKLTKNNLTEYKKMRKNHGRVITNLENKNIIGIDTTSVGRTYISVPCTRFKQNKKNKKTIKVKRMEHIDSELYIWKLPADFSIKLIYCKTNENPTALDKEGKKDDIYDYKIPINV